MLSVVAVVVRAVVVVVAVVVLSPRATGGGVVRVRATALSMRVLTRRRENADQQHDDCEQQWDLASDDPLAHGGILRGEQIAVFTANHSYSRSRRE